MRNRFIRTAQMLAMGTIMFQFGGCTFDSFNEFLQTVFLGITAAGSIAIIQNI